MPQAVPQAGARCDGTTQAKGFVMTGLPHSWVNFTYLEKHQSLMQKPGAKHTARRHAMNMMYSMTPSK
jgi:hypothetical protein